VSGLLARLAARASASGLEVRGAFHPAPAEIRELPPGGTVILLGFTGGLQWNTFERSAEAGDGRPDPLDRWSERVVGALARDFDAEAFYPNGSPRLPFQRLARRAEPVHQSPLGLLIHPRFGLWHAYRGALWLRTRIALPAAARSAAPCESCTPRPCLAGCPVNAFRGGTLDVEACVRHVRSRAGIECREHGCQARRACPEGSAYRYTDAQARFHMEAFLRAMG
jgi:hypothetical protein